MNKDETEEELSDLVTVCRSHFINDETQSQIAKKMGVSHAKVNKMIAKARARGIYSIQINDPIQLAHNLSRRLVDKYRLRDAVVVPVPRFGVKNILERVGQAAAETFGGLLRNNDIIGISGGSTLYEMLLKLEQVNIANGTIIPLLGGYGETEAASHGTEIAFRLAEKLGARVINMPVPGLAQDSHEAEVFTANPIVKKSMAWMRRCTIAIFGIGSADKEASLYKAGFLTDGMLDELREEDAAGCICFSFFNAKGEPCRKFNSKIIGLSLEDLMRIPVTIGVAGGAPNKIKSIVGAMNGGYINILVTDQITAEQLLEEGPAT